MRCACVTTYCTSESIRCFFVFSSVWCSWPHPSDCSNHAASEPFGRLFQFRVEVCAAGPGPVLCGSVPVLRRPPPRGSEPGARWAGDVDAEERKRSHSTATAPEPTGRRHPAICPPTGVCVTKVVFFWTLYCFWAVENTWKTSEEVKQSVLVWLFVFCFRNVLKIHNAFNMVRTIMKLILFFIYMPFNIKKILTMLPKYLLYYP